jgi:hypothetical protein
MGKNVRSFYRKIEMVHRVETPDARLSTLPEKPHTEVTPPE